MDAFEFRSTVSIGYVGYDPVTYYTRRDSPTMAVNSDGVCGPIEHATYFVSEIDWFVKKIFALPMAQFIAESPHMVGPSGLFGAINSMGMGKDPVSFIHTKIAL